MPDQRNVNKGKTNTFSDAVRYRSSEMLNLINWILRMTMTFSIKATILAIACCTASLTYAQSSPMNTTIIGSGSPLYNPDRVSAGVLITQGDTQILVDMGDGVKRNLDKFGSSTHQFDALLFTHHHLDHNADFAPLLVNSILGRRDFLVAGPDQTRDFVDSYLRLYEQDLNYRLAKSGRTLDQRKDSVTVRELASGESFHIKNIKVTTLSVPHTIESIAYRFDYQDQSVVVTGDLSSGPGMPEFAKSANCLIIDSGGMVMDNNGRTQKKNKKPKSADKTKKLTGGKASKQHAHINLAASSLIAERANVDRLVYTHFVTGEINESASKQIIEKQYKGEVVFGADLMTLDCGNSKSEK